MVAVIADLPNLTPGAMGFRVYHLKHHSHQGDYEYDADLRTTGKRAWSVIDGIARQSGSCSFPFFQVTRPAAFKSDQDVGPLVLYQFCVCGALRRGSRLFLRLAGVSLSRVRIFLFNWITPGRRSLDSRSITLTISTRKPSAITGLSIELR
jgi:hypothetical protein